MSDVGRCRSGVGEMPTQLSPADSAPLISPLPRSGRSFRRSAPVRASTTPHDRIFRTASAIGSTHAGAGTSTTTATHLAPRSARVCSGVSDRFRSFQHGAGESFCGGTAAPLARGPDQVGDLGFSLDVCFVLGVKLIRFIARFVLGGHGCSFGRLSGGRSMGRFGRMGG
jgi:hypothetical protein